MYSEKKNSFLIVGGAATVSFLALYGMYTYRRNLKLKEEELNRIRLELEAEKGNTLLFKVKLVGGTAIGLGAVYMMYKMKNALTNIAIRATNK